MLSELGFENVYVVKEQELPDGNFPTVSYPNPEADEAFELGLKLAREIDADLVLATDPDADRLGVRVKDKDGVYHTLTGNMSGCLLEEYELSQRKARDGKLPEDGAVVSTIVTTIWREPLRVLTVCALSRYSPASNISASRFLALRPAEREPISLDIEESYGCLIGTHARDKDAL